MSEDRNGRLTPSVVEEGSVYPEIASILEFGQVRGYIKTNEIYQVLPEAEHDEDLLGEVIARLHAADIDYIDSAKMIDPLEDGLEDNENLGDDPFKAEDDLFEHLDVNDSIGLYLKEATRVPLLTKDEELELSLRIERGCQAREELAQNNMGQKRRRELSRLIEDEWAAREHLITANSRLVISVAKRYIGRGVPFLDLIQEGNIGLMRAAKKFDYRRGYKFSTYATWWIRQAVTRAIADHGRTIRVPVHMGDQISKMLRTQHQLKQQLSRDPNAQELAEVLQVSTEKVEYMIQVAKRPISLQQPLGEDNDEDLGDFIEDREAPAPDETTAQNLLREHLEELLQKLPPREARILQLRYGLIDGKMLTLNEVGRKMGVTRERVRQIETQALHRLRNSNIQREYRAYD